LHWLTNCVVARSTEMQRGGHLLATEEPDLLAQEIGSALGGLR
jgi:hypothetical protein